MQGVQLTSNASLLKLDEGMRNCILKMLEKHEPTVIGHGEVGPTNKVDGLVLRLKEDMGTPKSEWRNYNPRKIEIMQGLVDGLEANGFVKQVYGEEAAGSCLSPPLIVQKKVEGQWRFVVDFRVLNMHLESESYGIPLMAHIWATLARQTHFASLDLKGGFHQLPVAPESQKLCGFNVGNRTYQYLGVPMGIKTAPQHFQRKMCEVILREHLGEKCFVFIDDILVFGSSEEEYLRNLDWVLSKLEEYRLKLNFQKCDFGMTEVEYLGYAITGDDRKIMEKRVQGILSMDRPKRAKELKSFLCMVGYYREFLHWDYPDKYHALSHFAADSPAKKDLEWTEELDAIYQSILRQFAERISIYHIDYTDDSADFILRTDASDFGIGGHLLQRKAVRSDNGEPLRDASGEPVTVENIVAAYSASF